MHALKFIKQFLILSLLAIEVNSFEMQWTRSLDYWRSANDSMLGNLSTRLSYQTSVSHEIYSLNLRPSIALNGTFNFDRTEIPSEVEIALGVDLWVKNWEFELSTWVANDFSDSLYTGNAGRLWFPSIGRSISIRLGLSGQCYTYDATGIGTVLRLEGLDFSEKNEPQLWIEGEGKYLWKTDQANSIRTNRKAISLSSNNTGILSQVPTQSDAIQWDLAMGYPHHFSLSPNGAWIIMSPELALQWIQYLLNEKGSPKDLQFIPAIDFDWSSQSASWNFNLNLSYMLGLGGSSKGKMQNRATENGIWTSASIAYSW